MQSELPKASKATTGQSGSIGKHDLAYGCGMASTKNNVMRQSHCANPYIYIYSYKHIYIYICIYVLDFCLDVFFGGSRKVKYVTPFGVLGVTLEPSGPTFGSFWSRLGANVCPRAHVLDFCLGVFLGGSRKVKYVIPFGVLGVTLEPSGPTFGSFWSRLDANVCPRAHVSFGAWLA